MATYARILTGHVVELFNPPSGVTIDECFTAEVVAQFVAVPDGVSPAEGWTYDGTTFAAPTTPSPTLSQQALAMLVAGIDIVSTGTPALNGTYAVDPNTYNRISGIVAMIGAGLPLPGGGSTFNWPDASGVPHVFDATSFKNFATAVANFEYALNTIAGSNTGTLPTQPTTIP